MADKRVLIITYYWPPTSGSGVQRWLKMVKYLSELGWKCVVYTPSNPEAMVSDLSLEKDIPSDAEVIKRPITEPYALYRRLLGRGGAKGGQSEVNPINNTGKKSFKERASLWVRANFFVPDPRVWWVRPSVRFLRKYLREHPVDVIVTTGPPHSMHLIGQRVSCELNIRHVVDFRDPWTNIFYFKHLPLWPMAARKHRRLEGEVLFDADAVVSVTRKITGELRELFWGYCEREHFLVSEEQKSKFYTVYNGFDEDDFICGSVANVPEKSFCVTHTGLLAADGNPDVLWRVLGQMCREDRQFQNSLVIRLVGKTDTQVLESIAQNGIMGNVVNMGYLPHSESAALQQQAWVLILPLRKEPEAKGILSGKFFEYMAAGRPILAVGPTDGELGAVLAETATGDIVEWDDEARTRAIVEKHYEKYVNGQWEFKTFKEEVQRYSRRREAEEMARVLEGRGEA